MIFRFLSIFLISSVILSSSCINKKQISGKEFIDREVLINVLVDIHLVDGITNDRRFHRRYDADSINMSQPIFEKYGVTKEMFDTTLAVYSRYPALLDEVYNEVLIQLNVMLDEIDQEEDVNRLAE